MSENQEDPESGPKCLATGSAAIVENLIAAGQLNPAESATWPPSAKFGAIFLTQQHDA